MFRFLRTSIAQPTLLFCPLQHVLPTLSSKCCKFLLQLCVYVLLLPWIQITLPQLNFKYFKISAWKFHISTHFTSLSPYYHVAYNSIRCLLSPAGLVVLWLVRLHHTLYHRVNGQFRSRLRVGDLELSSGARSHG